MKKILHCHLVEGRQAFDVYPAVVITLLSVPKYVLNASSNYIAHLCELKSQSSMTVKLAVGRM